MAGNSKKTGAKGPGRQFKPGQSGNPAGRPKIAEEFRQKARKAVDEHVLSAWVDELEVKPREVITVAGPVDVVARGKEWMRASELLAAYGYGKPSQPVTGPEGGPLQVESVVKIYLPENGRK